jgi:hypothetical protein
LFVGGGAAEMLAAHLGRLHSACSLAMGTSCTRGFLHLSCLMVPREYVVAGVEWLMQVTAAGASATADAADMAGLLHAATAATPP